ncbi:CDP-alcohol phosphatidyltransferase family protein [Lentiprolixibacter aurantiacus]|uniref:CDP-alcohol phosphatidyltransferase family protein n=1 Tax=Lentiprolixibacter aurantiacus TaxID=2993939 RepID=A0AAE3MMM9_9FLAO|nr:CDP-alcohol phosphatidyltransferase family protein [Lentiprolixibacter aurantiacus]MCX2720259.1 CDP-alcohol phosphatidyltransferase family protein [Lentiprolixibacter aurantiacus]
MPKLPEQYQFLDLSDYGRPLAVRIAQMLRKTTLTPIHVTLGFVISGLLGIYCILNEYYLGAVFFLILKSILDAADGELARIKNRPSYTGRFLDSVSDIILNFLIVLSIWYITNGSVWMAILAFIGLELQGTLYNYYYAILRSRHQGDTTSRVFETQVPRAHQGEEQKHVTLLFIMYRLCYGVFDRIIYALDRGACTARNIPNWLMTAVSTFGLGFQLLLIGLMLVFGLESYILPFFLFYSVFILVFIGLRRLINRENLLP